MSNEVAMRAKMVVVDVHEYTDEATGEATSTSLTFDAIGKSGAYPEDGSDENNTFSKFTPSARLTMCIQNPELMDKFENGQEFYLDFIPVPFVPAETEESAAQEELGA